MNHFSTCLCLFGFTKKGRERETGREREREIYIYIYIHNIYVYIYIHFLTPLPNLTIVCVFLRASGFDFLAKVSGLRLFFEHWTGECVQNQHLEMFSADLTFLDWIISRKLWNFERKLPYDTGKPFGPQRLNLFKFAQLQGAWLPAPSPRRRRSLRTPRVLWLGLVSWWCSRPCLSYLGYDTGLLSLWSGKTTSDWWPEGKQKKKNSFFTVNKGVLMVPLACSCPLAGTYSFHLIPYIASFASANAIFVVTSVVHWIGWECNTWGYSEYSFFCLALDPSQGVQTIHLPVVVLDAVSKPMFFTTIRADVLARFPCFVSEGTF